MVSPTAVMVTEPPGPEARGLAARGLAAGSARLTRTVAPAPFGVMAAGEPAAEQADTTARAATPAIVPNSLARRDATPMRFNLARPSPLERRKGS
jgi:hypothetical protein